MNAIVDINQNKKLHLGRSLGGFKNTLVEPYPVDFETLAEAVRSPQIGAKDGPYLTRCAFNTDQRNDANAKAGHLAIIDGDSSLNPQTGKIMNGAPDPLLVHEVLKSLDVQHCIYSSFSNSIKGHRYRVLIPVEVKDKTELTAVIDWLIYKLHTENVFINSVKENYTFAQCWFLPRVPDEKSLDNFVFYSHDGGEAFPKQEALDLSESQKIKPDVLTKKQPQTMANPNSSIDKFNAAHGLYWILKTLEKNGYKYSHVSNQDNETVYRFTAPSSESGIAGLVVLGSDKTGWCVYSHHGENDPLADGKSHDAFDLYVRFEHDGNFDKALLSLIPEPITYQQVLECDLEANPQLITDYRRQERRKFNNKYGLLMVEGQAVVVYRELNTSTSEHESRFAKKDSIKTLHANNLLPKIVTAKNAPPTLHWSPVFDDWIKSRTRRTYRQPVFNPVCGQLATEAMPDTQDYNLYLGAQFEPVKGDCHLILEHIKHTWCSGNLESNDYVIKWLARMIQQPDSQGRTVIVLRSGEGVGKNIILDLFDDYYGGHSALLSDPKSLAGFNDHLGKSVFVFLNECLWGGNKQNEGTFKTMITEKKLTVERKYLPKFKTRNYMHIFVATNGDWAVPVGLDDRRFFMLQLNKKHTTTKRYFDNLVNCIESGGREAFIYHLMHEVDLTGFDVAKMPQNESLTKLDHKIKTADSITTWWLNVLMDGGFSYEADLMGTGKSPCFDEWPATLGFAIDTPLVYASYCQATYGHKECKATMTKKIAELMGLETIPTKRPNIAPRIRQYCLPPLNEVKSAIEAVLGQSVPWFKDEND